MIGWLRGILREKQPPHLVLEVNGVGYELEAPLTTFSLLPSLGEELTLFTHQLIREDSHSLYAFAQREERNVFRQLLRVSGVGAKLALAILSGMHVDELFRCVHERDIGRLAQLPGIGKKTAERLVIELRDRLQILPGLAPEELSASSGEQLKQSDVEAQAVSALVTLGFKQQDAWDRMRRVRENGLACEELVRRALKSLAK
ncbi:MAG: Holliday junction branch migration protein RuvA [Gammaproteobacteria bacterium]